MVKISLDYSVNYRAWRTLAEHNYLVVCQAKVKESDDEWIIRTLSSRADVVVTNDKEVQRRMKKLGLKVVPFVKGKNKQVNSILQNLRTI